VKNVKQFCIRRLEILSCSSRANKEQKGTDVRSIKEFTIQQSKIKKPLCLRRLIILTVK